MYLCLCLNYHPLLLCLFSFSFPHSPGYNRIGWLGVKHQVTYSLTFSLCLCLSLSVCLSLLCVCLCVFSPPPHPFPLASPPPPRPSHFLSHLYLCLGLSVRFLLYFSAKNCNKNCVGRIRPECRTPLTLHTRQGSQKSCISYATGTYKVCLCKVAVFKDLPSTVTWQQSCARIHQVPRRTDDTLTGGMQNEDHAFLLESWMAELASACSLICKPWAVIKVRGKIRRAAWIPVETENEGRTSKVKSLFPH